MWLVQGAAIYINIAAPCTTEIHTENQHFTLRVKPRVQPRFLHRLLILCFSCNPVIPKNKKSPKHFPFSVKIPIFASVPRAERSNAAKPAQLPNRYRLPNFLLFKSYLPTDYKKTIVFLELSVDTFIEKKGLLKEGEISASNSSRSLYQKVNDASQYLYKEKIADETILKAVKLLTKERNSIWGVDTMNAYVHSNKLSPVPIDIQTTWDNIQDFMVTLWSQIESE